VDARLLNGVAPLGGSRTGAAAVSMAIGTQVPYNLDYLIGAIVSQPVAWLGLLGAVLLVADPRYWRSKPRALTTRYPGAAEQRLPAFVFEVIARDRLYATRPSSGRAGTPATPSTTIS